MTLNHLIDEGVPRLTNPTTAIFAYWREHLGDVRLDKITPELVAQHRDLLLGADCRGHKHKTARNSEKNSDDKATSAKPSAAKTKAAKTAQAKVTTKPKVAPSAQ